MFESLITGGLTAQSFLICTAVSLVLGLLTALCFSFRASFSKSFCLTLAILPAIVQMIIMMVSGSIGAGVAVAGTFSLVRFRSEPGTARQIAALFLAMALGMGYAVLAAVFFLIVTLFFLLLTLVNFGGDHGAQRDLRITIPESMDYEGVFDDLFQKYTTAHSLERVRTTNMGTLYELRYTVQLKNEKEIKAFMDEIRTRNGNLTIICGRVSTESAL